jgi:REP element-mobilizing transposase RayT
MSRMAGMLGYMVTWTTYDTWLQGDRRGYVKNGQILPGDKIINETNRNLQKYGTIILSKNEKETIRQTILDEAAIQGHKILAIAVCTNHVHLVAEPCKFSIEDAVSRYKNKATLSLRKFGRPDRLWTKGFDKRFCFTLADLAARIDYVEKHNR